MKLPTGFLQRIRNKFSGLGLIDFTIVNAGNYQHIMTLCLLSLVKIKYFQPVVKKSSIKQSKSLIISTLPILSTCPAVHPILGLVDRNYTLPNFVL